jgi:hypothetical protein
MERDKQITVWRALDADSSFFGIKGSYLMLFLLFAVAAIILSILVMQTAGRFLGFLLAFTALVVDYMLVKSIQGRYSTRQFRRLTDRGRFPRFLKVRPMDPDFILRRAIPWR